MAIIRPITNKSQYGPTVLSTFSHFHLMVNCWQEAFSQNQNQNQNQQANTQSQHLTVVRTSSSHKPATATLPPARPLLPSILEDAIYFRVEPIRGLNYHH